MVKESLTAEQIVEIAEQNAKTDTVTAIRRQINKLFRKQDDSHLYPINGAFNVTERAIQRAHRYESQSGVGMDDSLEYALFLEAETSRIVNSDF